MNIVMHKYTPEEIPEAEMIKTFAARQHTLEFLADALRKQTTAGTLSSYLITGPRGAGKSLLLRMLRVRIWEDASLKGAWLVVRFPEEQFNIASVRDLLAATLKLLSEEKVPLAGNWLARVEAESDDEQSEELAVSALREISRQQGRRFILFVENLDEFFDHAITDNMKGTLRRLLMTDPFMLIIGSAVHVFESLKRYDEAFFNYFTVVRLERLNEKEVYELLQKRAEFDGNEQFLRKFPRLKPKIRAMTHLSGGNPRLILMLYELLSQKHVTTLVQELRRLVDELTPLLKHEMEDLPPQQQKIIHALMEKGGTATPADLTTPTRLPLNTVTAQLRRLKEAQILDLRRGGKGRAAYYTVPDKLFSIWYQMRFLNQRRRQIEMFVEVIRIWFEEEERLRTLTSLIEGCETAAPHAVRESAATAEYFAASLIGTTHEEKARDIALRQWLRIGDVREAALAHAGFAGINITNQTQAYASFGQWFMIHDDPKTALPALEAAAQESNEPGLLVMYSLALGKTGNYALAVKILDRVVPNEGNSIHILAPALINRGVCKGFQGDLEGAIADYTTLIGLSGAAVEDMANALFNRGAARGEQGDFIGAIADYTSAVELPNVPVGQLSQALVNRGVAKGLVGDWAGEITDCTRVVEMRDAPVDQVAKALVDRGVAKVTQGDEKGGVTDYSAVLTLPNVPSEEISQALVNRGAVKGRLGDFAGAIADCNAAIDVPNVAGKQAAQALGVRGMAKFSQGDHIGAVADWIQSMATVDAPVDERIKAALAAYAASWVTDNGRQAEDVLAKFSELLSSVNVSDRKEVLIRWLGHLVHSGHRQGWIAAWRYFTQHEPQEVVESLAMLAPVCEVLEKGDRSVLDPLPPEQREFAEQVLAQFETMKS
jgi:tetratricopeptide (TPR) repeat protein